MGLAGVLAAHVYEGIDLYAGGDTGLCRCTWQFRVDADTDDVQVWAAHVAAAVLAWLETLAQDEGVRARVVREIDDHADYSHGAYGTPDAATAAVTAFLAAAREA